MSDELPPLIGFVENEIDILGPVCRNAQGEAWLRNMQAILALLRQIAAPSDEVVCRLTNGIFGGSAHESWDECSKDVRRTIKFLPQALPTPEEESPHG